VIGTSTTTSTTLACGANGTPCSSNADCCSGYCPSGGPGKLTCQNAPTTTTTTTSSTTTTLPTCCAVVGVTGLTCTWTDVSTCQGTGGTAGSPGSVCSGDGRCEATASPGFCCELLGNCVGGAAQGTPTAPMLGELNSITRIACRTASASNG
jgi:hypothetical protein